MHKDNPNRQYSRDVHKKYEFLFVYKKLNTHIYIFFLPKITYK